jgi:TonB family protein
VVLLAVGCISAPGVLWSQQPPAASKSGTESLQQSATEAGKAKDAGEAVKPPDGLASDIEILSDTAGTDFKPYLHWVVPDIRKNWLRLMPESALPPVLKSGRVAVEFAILKDGKVAGLKLVASSGDDALDRAPHSAILASRPFPSLPSGFKGQYLILRMNFHYNPPPMPVTSPARLPSGKATPAAAPPKNR